MGKTHLTIALDSGKLIESPELTTWLRVIGAEVEEGQIALISFPRTTQVMTITPRRFRIFEPGISGNLIIDLELNVHETDSIFFEGAKNATTSKPE